MAYLGVGEDHHCSSWTFFLWVTEGKIGSVSPHPGFPSPCAFGVKYTVTCHPLHSSEGNGLKPKAQEGHKTRRETC